MGAFFQLVVLLAAEVVTRPFVGVTHVHRTEDLPRPVSMHVVKVDLTAPGLSLRLTAPAGTRETVRQSTLEFLEEQKAQVAVNAHFFVPYPSADMDVWLVGLAAQAGNVYSDFEAPEQSYALMANAPALNIDAENRASILRSRDGAWTAVSGSAQVITGGQVTIPSYKEGELTPGGPGNYSNERSWYEVPNARTIAGLSEDRQTLFLFTVDRASGSQGMTVAEAATLLQRDYGVFDALNLDGGGSTTLVIEGQGIVNKSSDNPLGRKVGSNLAIFAQKLPPE